MMNFKGLTKKTLATIASLGVLALSSASAINMDAFKQAIESGNKALAMQLLQQGDVDETGSPNPYYPTALVYSIFNNHIDCVEYLINHGANLYLKFMDMAPIHWAVIKANSEILKLLLSHGANPNVQMVTGCTPLYTATYYGETNIVKLLLEHGADSNIPDNDGDTPLHVAIRKNDFSAVEVLLKEGADPTIPNNKGETAESLLRQSPNWPRFAPYILNDNELF